MVGRGLEAATDPKSQAFTCSFSPQGLGPLGASSLGFPWGTPSKHPSCQVSRREITFRGLGPLISLGTGWGGEGNLQVEATSGHLAAPEHPCTHTLGG